MEYVLTSFQQQLNVRRFYFKGTNEARERLEFIVGVDLSLARKHNIPVQDLPLLCLRHLEARTSDAQPRGVNFTDAQFADYAAQRDAEKKRTDSKRRGHFKSSAKVAV
jgi:hypothetical protein